MNCLRCGEETDVLQTFGEKDCIVRVRGHRDQTKCGYRARTIERYTAFESEGMVESAQPLIRELSSTLSRMQHIRDKLMVALGMTDLASVLDAMGSEDDIYSLEKLLK